MTTETSELIQHQLIKIQYQVENLKNRAQTLMFSENKSEDGVSKFRDEIDQRLTVFDDKFDDLQAAIDKVKSVEVMIAKGNFEVEEQRRM